MDYYYIIKYKTIIFDMEIMNLIIIKNLINYPFSREVFIVAALYLSYLHLYLQIVNYGTYTLDIRGRYP